MTEEAISKVYANLMIHRSSGIINPPERKSAIFALDDDPDGLMRPWHDETVVNQTYLMVRRASYNQQPRSIVAQRAKISGAPAELPKRRPFTTASLRSAEERW